ncbi:MAG: PTS sugar transporter subunit IIA [Candidatus Eisenbacteria bacterium]
MVIAELTSVAGIPLDVVELKPKRREAAMLQMLAAAHARGAVLEDDVVLAALAHRELLGTTAIGKGCALAGVRSLGVRSAHLVLGRSTRGVEWNAPDSEPVQLALLALAPAAQSVAAHVEWLASLAQVLRLQRSRQRLLDAEPGAVAALFEGRPA